MANNLKNENSPYLLQHADNPVNWYPWSETPFEIAKKNDLPIFLSIGYSSCHWCHVMEKESFTDLNTATYLNENFISIKVDREERPDIDSIYMEALQALTGSGGWPASLFLSPDKIPFFAGTYFPLIDRGHHPSFIKVLKLIVEHYKHKKDKINEIGSQITNMLNTDLKYEPISSNYVEQTIKSINKSFDQKNGGFHDAPKFPQPSLLEFLIFIKQNYIQYSEIISESELDEILIKSLYKMSIGGIYDQIGGGFHRYTVDANWLTPHFEKMLYDNALLSSIYSKAYSLYQFEWLGFISDDILQYLTLSMSEKGKGFFSAEDADSEGEEGKYYTFTSNELNNIFDTNDIENAKNLFNISEQGNFEGKNILTGGISYELNTKTNDNFKNLDFLRSELFNYRDKRKHPFKDKKIITSWNGMTVSALMDQYFLKYQKIYLDKAIQTIDYITSFIGIENELPRYVINDSKFSLGTLEDYAFFIEALIKLHKGTLDYKWLNMSLVLSEKVLELFYDDSTHIMYDSSKDLEDLFTRPKSIYDNPYSSSFAKITECLYYLGSVTNNNKYINIVDQIISSVSAYINNVPMHTSSWIKLLEMIKFDRKNHLIILHDDKNIDELLMTLDLNNKSNLNYLGKSKQIGSDLEIFEDKIMIDNKTTFYLCKSYTCNLPTNSIKEIKSQVKTIF